MNPRLYSFSNSLIAVAAFLLHTIVAQAQVTVSGGTSAAGSYTTLADAMTAINAHAATGPITVSFAAGHTETAPNKGIHIGSATLNPTLSATNTLNITGPATIFAGVGDAMSNSNVEHDGIIKVVGADYVTISGLTLIDNNPHMPENMEYGIGFYKAGGTDGSQHCTVQNCTITLSRNNISAGGGARGEGSVGILVLNALSATPLTALTITAASGSHSFNKFYGNTISQVNYGIHISGFPATVGNFNPDPGTFFGDIGNDVGGNSPSTGNTIRNFGGGVNSSGTASTLPAAGIRNLNQWGSNISYNTLNSNNGSGANHTGTLHGILLSSSPNANVNITHNTITVKSAATSSAMFGIENSAGVKTLNTNTNKTVISNNNITDCTYSGTLSGLVYFIWNNQASGGADTLRILNNTINNNTLNTSSVVYGIFSSASVALFNRDAQINNNTITNLTRNNSGTTFGINCNNSSRYEVNGNTIANLTNNAIGSGSGTLYGVQVSTNVTTTSQAVCVVDIKNNTINNLVSAGTSTATFSSVFGIYAFNSTLANVIRNIEGNTVSNLRSVSGGGTIYGIWNSTGGNPSSNSFIQRNKIFNIFNTTVTSTTAGIYSTTTNSTFISNNIIGGIRTPNLNTTSLTAHSGILLFNSSGNVQVDHNTVLLNSSANPTGTFNSSALYATTGSTLTSRNNILVNLNTPSASGNAAAFRRSSTTLTGYDNASNNNLYYVSASPASNRLLYVEAASSNAFNTLSALKTYMATRDQASISEAPNFLSTNGNNPNFLHINPSTPTFIESGGVAIPGITNDFDNQTRNPSTPDIGADEFNGTQPPLCSAVPNAGTSTTANSTLCTGNGTSLSNNAVNYAIGVAYQWEVSDSPTGPWTDATGAGANTQFFNLPNNLAAGTYYYALKATCTLTDSFARSNVLTININQTPVATASSNSPVCRLGTIELAATSDLPGATFTWTGPSGFNAAVATASIPNADYNNSGNYNVVATVNGCPSAPAPTNVFVSYTPPAPTILPTSDVVACPDGEVAVPLSVSSTAGATSITIGTGTTTNTGTSYPTPYGDFWESTRMQYLWLASELMSQGLAVGSTINGINLPVTTVGSAGIHENFTISIGTTTATSLSTAAGWQPANQLVFGPVNYQPVAGNNFHAFSTPFVWTGGNIIIETCHYDPNSATTSTFTNNAQSPFTVTPFTSAIWRNSDNVNNCQPNTTTPTGSSSNRVNITFNTTPPNVSYTWSGPAGTFSPSTGLSVLVTPLVTSTYTVVANTQDGCSSSATKVVTILDPIDLSVSSTPVTCVGLTNGTATALATGGTGSFIYAWSTGNVGAHQTNLANGTYEVTVTTGPGCTASASVEVAALPAVVATATQVSEVSCFGGNNGVVSVTAVGGTPPYTGTGTFNGLMAGLQTFTVTDVNGCQNSATVTVTQPELLTASATSTNVPCFGGATGSLSVTAGGGVGNYSYSWSNSASTANVANVTAGTYTVVVTDGNGCTASASTTINQPTELMAAVAAQVNVLCHGNATGSAQITASGGVPAYTFQWSNGASSQSVSGLSAGAYTVIVTDANGCTKSVAVNITQPAPLILSGSTTKPTCAPGAFTGTNNGTATITATGGVMPYSGTGTFSGLTAGNYSYTVTDNNGCTSSITVTVQPGAPNTTYYLDSDQDGFGTPNTTILACTGVPAGYQANNQDCNDNNPNIYPFAQEIENGIDDDCNGVIDDVCGVPTGLTVSNITNTSAVLSWNPTINLKKYIVQYRAVGATSWIQIATALSTSTTPSPATVTLTGLANNTVYQWRVRTHCNSGFTNFSPVSTFTTGSGTAPCLPPQYDGGNKVGTDAFNIKWIPNGAINYQVRYRPVGSNLWIVATSANNAGSLILTGLLSGTTYQYQIRSRCQNTPAVFSEFGPINTFTPGGTQDLAAPNTVFTTSGVTVYPNPTHSYLYIDNMPENIASVSIADIRGAILLQAQLQDIENGINVIDLIDGTYYIVMRTTSGDRITVPFVKSGR